MSAKLVGIQLVEVREGYAVTELTLNENQLNGLIIVQGGVMFTLDGVGSLIACFNGLGYRKIK